MGRPEEAHDSQPHGEEPPPPYSEDDAPPLPPRDTKNNPFHRAAAASPYSPIGPTASSSKSKLPTPIPHSGKFPATLGMYYQKAVRTPTFNLGESEDRPSFAVTFHTSGGAVSGTSYLLLHSTADPESPPLAIAEKVGRLGHRAEITLSGLPGSDQATEEMGTHVSITSVSYTFSIETGHGRREKFEWRSSKGSEVKGLSSDKHPTGRKLVRLDTEADGVGGTRAVRDQGATSDGREVVAVWADNAKWSGNKAGVLQFLGSGASGVLGERFGVMAIVTAVRIWEMLNETSMQSAATSSLGAGNSG